MKVSSPLLLTILFLFTFNRVIAQNITVRYSHELYSIPEEGNYSSNNLISIRPFMEARNPLNRFGINFEFGVLDFHHRENNQTFNSYRIGVFYERLVRLNTKSVLGFGFSLNGGTTNVSVSLSGHSTSGYVYDRKSGPSFIIPVTYEIKINNRISWYSAMGLLFVGPDGPSPFLSTGFTVFDLFMTPTQRY